MNICEAGHKEHVRVRVKTKQGLMEVWNWGLYRDFRGYCTGQCDVSRTLFNNGVWEEPETELVRKLLKKNREGGLVLDIGCNVGWYSLLALRYGYSVIAIDGDQENCDITKRNILGQHSSKVNATVLHKWIDINTAKEEGGNFGEIYLFKSDIEGLDAAAVEWVRDSFEQQLVKYALIEVSPVFNDTYGPMVDKLLGWGYKPYDLDGKDLDATWVKTVGQHNVLFALGPPL